ncbi:MAG: trans-sulfuration enzyme family protein [Bacteroidota bacterium]
MKTEPIMNKPSYKLSTKSVHAAHPKKKDPFGAHVMPLYQTSTYMFDSVEAGRKLFAHEEGGATHAYSRLGNPTVEALEQTITELETAELVDEEAKNYTSFAFGSGMAAITTTLISLASQQGIVAQEALYGCTSQFLEEEAPRMGINVDFVDVRDLRLVEETLKDKPKTRVLYIESIANPTMTINDVLALAELAHQYNALLVVDNTFATPYHMQPLALGADVVLHSTTKYLSGHGTIIGGSVTGKQELFEEAELMLYRKNLGGIAGPFDAWLTLNGVKTFTLRMERHVENAQKVAAFLEQHPAVNKVHYPGLQSHPQHKLALQQFINGFGGVLSFELNGGYDAGVHLMEQVELCSLAVSLGNVDTLIQHPASMTHSVMDPELREKAGITEGLVRLSVGIEDVDDIIDDLDQAMPAG